MRPYFVEIAQNWGIPPWMIPDDVALGTLGVLLAALLTLRLWMREGRPLSTGVVPILACLPLLLIGAKTLYLAQYGFSLDWSAWTGNGMSLYGGLLGILAGLAISRRRLGPDFRTYLDCLAPGLALGLAVGRIGCFLHGCNGGIACNLPWAVRYPPDSQIFRQHLEAGWISNWHPASLPVHPTQLYEACFGAAAMFCLLKLRSTRPPAGTVFFSGLLWYGLFRFLVEEIRCDSGGWHPFGLLTFAQLVSVFVAGTAGLWLLKARFLRTPEAL